MENFTVPPSEFRATDSGTLPWRNFSTIILLATLVVSLLVRKISRKTSWLSKGNPKQSKTLDKPNTTTKGIQALPSTSMIKLSYEVIRYVPLPKVFKVLEEKAKIYKDVVRISLLNYNIVVINSAKLLEPLLKSGNLGHLHRPSLLRMIGMRLVQTGFLVADGKLWQTQRKIAARSQKSSVVEVQMETICKHSKQCVKSLENMFKTKELQATPQAIKPLLSILYVGFALESNTGFRELNSHTLHSIHKCLDTIVEGFGKRIVNPLALLFWKLFPSSLKHNQAIDQLLLFIDQVVNQHINERKLEKQSSSGMKVRNVIDELLEEGVDKKQITQDVLSLILGASDTSGHTAQFFCMMMCINPNMQQKCQQEVDEQFNANPSAWNDGKVTLDIARNELKYLECCILETLRLFPPIFGLGRELTTSLDIQYEGNTVRLPAGTPILFFPYLIHRKEEYYPKPEKFIPSRFEPEEIKKRHPFAYLPFSAGPRNCVGYKLAILQLKVSLAYMLRSFNMKTVDNMDDIPLLPHVLLTPQRNYRFCFERRNV